MKASRNYRSSARRLTISRCGYEVTRPQVRGFGIGWRIQGPFSELAHRSASSGTGCASRLIDHEIELVHYDTIGLARYKKYAPNIPSVITHHNIESNLMARRSEVERSAPGRWYVARQARLLRESEATESTRFDCNVMMSATDEADLKEMAPGDALPSFQTVSIRRFPTRPGGSGAGNHLYRRHEYVCQ